MILTIDFYVFKVVDEYYFSGIPNTEDITLTTDCYAFWCLGRGYSAEVNSDDDCVDQKVPMRPLNHREVVVKILVLGSHWWIKIKFKVRSVKEIYLRWPITFRYIETYYCNRWNNPKIKGFIYRNSAWLTNFEDNFHLMVINYWLKRFMVKLGFIHVA